MSPFRQNATANTLGTIRATTTFRSQRVFAFLRQLYEAVDASIAEQRQLRTHHVVRGGT
jgi:hypothetical protein